MVDTPETPCTPSPPLRSWSTFPSAPSEGSPSSASDSDLSTSKRQGTHSPTSSVFSTPRTALTTPDAVKSPVLQTADKFELVGEPAEASPPGYGHLERQSVADSGHKPRSFGWETYIQPPRDGEGRRTAPRIRYKRRLGPTEASYHLGSRGEGVEGGVNDMYLHLGFTARASLMTPTRILDAWDEVVRRHALLASVVEFRDYYDIGFVYDSPTSREEARLKAASLLALLPGWKGKDLVSEYLNGPRFLSDHRLAFLVVSTPEPAFSLVDSAGIDPEAEQEYELLLLSTHFLGDGMALHATANELFTLLAGEPTVAGVVSRNVEAVFAAGGAQALEAGTVDETALLAHAAQLAPAMESKIATPKAWGRFGWAAAKVEFDNEQANLVGGHAFPRARLGTRRTVVPTVSWPENETKAILAACKRRGVTIAHAMFALSSIAYVRTVDDARRKPDLPVMLYSALNVRPFLRKEDPSVDWYHIAIGYYNIILPSFILRTLGPAAHFWHQCQSVKAQTTRAVKTPFLASRTALMALERERRSVGFERAEDEKRVRAATNDLEGLGISGVDAAAAAEGKPVEAQQEKPSAVTKEEGEPEEDKHVRPRAPSTALMGLSMLGNLDGVYKHADLHGIRLDTLTTGSRQRPGAVLLFTYTFAGKLWVSLGYDANGFEPGVIERWHTALVAGVEQFLLLDEEQARRQTGGSAGGREGAGEPAAGVGLTPP